MSKFDDLRPPEAIALIDLDGTLANYEESMSEHLMMLKSDEEEFLFPSFGTEAPDYIWNRVNMIRKLPGWWRNLPRIESGFNIVHLLKKHGCQLHVLTKSPRSSSNAWTEKFEWCQEHIPEADVTISGKKENVYGRILFDDYPGYVEPWLQNRPRGLAILPLQEWNKDFSHPRAVHWTGENFYIVEERIIDALADI